MSEKRNMIFAVFGVGLLVMIGASQHVPGAQPASPEHSVQSVTPDDCHAQVIDEEGTPSPGTPRLDPQKLCDALKRAEQEAGQR